MDPLALVLKQMGLGHGANRLQTWGKQVLVSLLVMESWLLVLKQMGFSHGAKVLVRLLAMDQLAFSPETNGF